MSTTGFDALATVFMDATDPILIEDLQGIVLDLNREAERVYRWSRDELIGSPIKRIVPPERHEQADDLLRQCRGGKEVRNVQGLRVSKDGVVHDVLLTLSLLKNDGGDPVAIATFAKDITALREAEAALKRHGEELETIVRERTRELQETLSELEQSNTKLERELSLARERAEAARRNDELVLLGESIAARALREGIERQSQNDQPLLLTGPMGAGYDAVARAIHFASDRRDGPFLYVDCHYVLGEEERVALFSEGGRPSKLALADGGTIYLEAINALDKRGQELLRTYLDATKSAPSREMKRLPDVRVLAYSQCDLGEEVIDGHFDPRLAEHLGHQRLSLPSLAERREDLGLMSAHIVARRGRKLGKIFEGVDEASLDRIERYGWPGNLTELRAVLERAAMLARGATVIVEKDALHEGPRLGGYRLTKLLGKGGMGEVWRGEHDLLARPAAIKLIRDEMGDADAALFQLRRERFAREAQSTARLRSPHTVELYDFGIDDKGTFYYVMELLEGLDLLALVQDFGPLSPARTVYLLRQACLSLAEAHEANLVHRDIKPANLFVARLGAQYDQLKILDFGIVKSLQEKVALTGTGIINGTPGYLAPEQVIGDHEADPRSDLYALGCVAYWMLTGREVFSASTPMKLIFKHVQEEPTPLSKLCELPDALSATVMSCLEKDPAQRPDSALDLERMLRDIPLPNPWDREAAAAWWHENEVLSAPGEE